MANYYNQMLAGMQGFQNLIEGKLESGQDPYGAFNAEAPNGYSMFTEPDFSFLQLNPEDGPVSGDWKFHLTVTPDDVPEAWNIVADELMRDSPNHTAKVVKPDTAERFANPDNPQAGKMITIYPNDKHSYAHYQNLLRRIERKLAATGINPGPSTTADRAVPGSKYASYRRETGPDGKYMSSTGLSNDGIPQEKMWNPYDAPDPYHSMDFSAVYSFIPDGKIYDGMNENSIHKLGDYGVVRNGGWIQIIGPEANFEMLDKTGAKFQITTHPDDVKMAWDIVADELVNSGLSHAAKVADPELVQDLSNPQHNLAGKMVTIYPQLGVPSEDYQALMQRIQDRLDEAGVRAGPNINDSTLINGSENIFVYTNQEEANMPPGQSKPHNPYANFVLERNQKTQTGHNNPMHAIVNGDWQEAMTGSNMVITRLAIGNMTSTGVEALERELRRQGLEPIRHTSASLGPTIRLRGADIPELEAVQEKLAEQSRNRILKANWFEVTDRNKQMAQYVRIDNMPIQERVQLENSLAAQDINFERKTSSLKGGIKVLAVTDAAGIDAIDRIKPSFAQAADGQEKQAKAIPAKPGLLGRLLKRDR